MNSKDLVSLSTGKLVTPEMERDLLQAEALGEEACKAFSKERLESDPAKLKFHDTVTKLKVEQGSDH